MTSARLTISISIMISLLLIISYTVNVYIFALYIFSRNSRFLNLRENIYTSKITFIITYRANYTQNANFNTHEIAHFINPRKCIHAKISTLTVYNQSIYLKTGNCYIYIYMVKSHEMDSLGGCVCNSGGHIITYYKKYF